MELFFAVSDCALSNGLSVHLVLSNVRTMWHNQQRTSGTIPCYVPLTLLLARYLTSAAIGKSRFCCDLGQLCWYGIAFSKLEPDAILLPTWEFGCGVAMSRPRVLASEGNVEQIVACF